MALSPIFPDVIKTPAIEIDSVDTTTLIDLVTAGANGSRINSISATSTDTAAIELLLWFNDGVTDFQIGRVTIPAGSGTDGTNKPVSVLNDVDLPFLGSDLSYYLEAAKKLRVSVAATMTAATILHLVANVGDY